MDFEDDFEDDFDIGEFGDFGNEPEPPANNREAIIQGASKISSSFKKELLSTDLSANLKMLTSTILPDNLSEDGIESIDAVSGIHETMAESFREVKNATKDMSNMLADLAPEGDFQDTLYSKINSIFGKDEYEYHEEDETEKVDIAKEAVSSLLGEQKDLENEKTNIREAIRNNLSKKENELLSIIATNINRTRLFHMEVTDKYYRKSLELKYKHLYVARQQSLIFTGAFDTFKTQLAEITKNTGLPDLVKTTKSEVIKSEFFNNYATSLFQDKDSWLNTLKNNITNNVKGVSNAIVGGKDMLESGVGMADSMGSMGGGPMGMAGQELGNMFKIRLSKILNKKLMETKVGRNITDKVTDFTASPSSIFEEKALNTTGVKSTIYSSIANLFSNPDEDTLKKIKSRDVDSPAMFDGRIYNSISRVIPELLSKILQQVEKVNNKNTGELRFDHTTGEFNFKEDTITDFKRVSKYKMVDNNIISNIKGFINDIEDETNVKLSKDEHGEIAEGLVSWVMKGLPVSPKTLKDKGFYNTLDENLGIKLESMMTNYMDVSGEEYVTRNRNITNTFSDVKKEISNPEELINKYKDEGRVDELIKSGLVVKNDLTNEYEINLEEYRRTLSKLAKEAMDDDFYQEASESIRRENSEDIKAFEKTKKIREDAMSVGSSIRESLSKNVNNLKENTIVNKVSSNVGNLITTSKDKLNEINPLNRSNSVSDSESVTKGANVRQNDISVLIKELERNNKKDILPETTDKIDLPTVDLTRLNSYINSDLDRETIIKNLKVMKLPKEYISKVNKYLLKKKQNTLRLIESFKQEDNTIQSFVREKDEFNVRLLESVINSNVDKITANDIPKVAKELNVPKSEIKRITKTIKIKDNIYLEHIPDFKNRLDIKDNTEITKNNKKENVKALKDISNTIINSETTDSEKINSIKTLFNSYKDKLNLKEFKIDKSNDEKTILNNLVLTTSELLEKVKDDNVDKEKNRKGNFRERLAKLSAKDERDLKDGKPLESKSRDSFSILKMLFPIIFGIGTSAVKLIKATGTVTKAIFNIGKTILSIPKLLGSILGGITGLGSKLIKGIGGLLLGKGVSDTLSDLNVDTMDKDKKDKYEKRGRNEVTRRTKSKGWKGKISDGFSYLTDKVKSGYEKVKSIGSNIWESGAKLASSTWDYTKGKVSKAVDYVKGGLAGKMQYFKKGGKLMAMATLIGGTAIDYVKKHSGTTIKWVMKAGKKIPLVGIPLVVGEALYYAYQGEYAKAGLSVGSGLLAQVPVVGTVASIGLDTVSDSMLSKAPKPEIDKGDELKDRLNNKTRTDGTTPTKMIPQNETPSSESYSSSTHSGKGLDPATSFEGLTEYMKKEEKFTPRAFWDFKQYTNGYGTKAKHKNEVITKDEALRRFKKDVKWRYNKVKRFINKSLPTSVLHALTDLTYNAGVGWMSSGLGKLAKKGNNIDAISNKILQYDKARKNGKLVSLPGLTKRRHDEVSWIKRGGKTPFTKKVNKPVNNVTPVSTLTDNIKTSPIESDLKVKPSVKSRLPKPDVTQVMTASTIRKADANNELLAGNINSLNSIDNTLKLSLNIHKEILKVLKNNKVEIIKEDNKIEPKPKKENSKRSVSFDMNPKMSNQKRNFR